ADARHSVTAELFKHNAREYSGGLGIMARIVGIDLGTTNSLIAYMDGKTPTIIPDADGHALVPSIVAYTPEGLLVGDAAKDQLTRHPERTVYSVKRFMGKGLSDVQDELQYFPYRLTEQAGAIQIQLADKALRPREFFALISKDLKSGAEGFSDRESRKRDFPLAHSFMT